MKYLVVRKGLLDEWPYIVHRARLFWWRNFVAILLLIPIAVASLWAAPYWEAATSPLVEARESPALTFDGALAFAGRMKRYAGRVPMPPLDRSGLMSLAAEIVPYYAYNDLGAGTYPPVRYNAFPGEQHFHVLGRYYLFGVGGADLNIRFENRYSSRWYSAWQLLSILVHELGHAQGISGWGELGEPMTQIATLEILASMVRDGNIWALPAFIRQVGGYAEDYAYSQALQQDRLGEYEAWLDRYRDEFDLAIYYKSKDHWNQSEGYQERLQEILTKYGQMPWVLLNEALNDPELKTREWRGIPNGEHRIQLNDTAWVLEHLPALVRDYDQFLRSYYLRIGEGPP